MKKKSLRQKECSIELSNARNVRTYVLFTVIKISRGYRQIIPRSFFYLRFVTEISPKILLCQRGVLEIALVCTQPSAGHKVTIEWLIIADNTGRYSDPRIACGRQPLSVPQYNKNMQSFAYLSLSLFFSSPNIFTLFFPNRFVIRRNRKIRVTCAPRS